MSGVPVVSVITVVFNSVELIEKTVESVISQNCDEMEYIVVDGGSTDGTLNVLNKYQEYISYLVSEPDNGIYDAMNKAKNLVSGRWILFLNAGDVFVSDSVLSDVISILKNSYNYDIVYGNCIYDYGFTQRRRDAGDLTKLPYGMQFSHQSCFISAEYHRKNDYNLSFRLAADYEFFLRAYVNGASFLFVDMVISKFLVDGASYKKAFYSSLEAYRAVKKNKMLSLGIYFSFLYRMMRGYVYQFLILPAIGEKGLLLMRRFIKKLF